MKTRCIAVLLVVSAVASADAREELEFAKRLAVRGHLEMAEKFLTTLSKDSDSKLARAGKYGLAILDLQRATLLRNRYLNALHDDETPTVDRVEIMALYSKAVDDVKAYIASAPTHYEARFQYGELLQQYAEFLTGKGYPERLAAEAAELKKNNKDEATKLFDIAIAEFDAVYKGLDKKVRDRKASDEEFRRYQDAEFNRGRASMRQALVQDSLVRKTNGLEEAIELLDAFQSRYYDVLYGYYVVPFLGEAYRELGLARGNVDDVDIGLDYFEACFGPDRQEDPAVPDFGVVMALGFHRYADTCVLLARGPAAGPRAGKLKKAYPAYYDKAIQAGAILDRKLVQSSKLPDALRAKLLIAEAYAARGKLPTAVAIVGRVLDTAKFSGQGAILREASGKLTGWLAGAGGVELDPELLYQLGESEAAQGRGAQAIAAFERAVSTSETDEEMEKYAAAAWLRIAQQYRRDGRFYAAVEAASKVVDMYKKSGQDETSLLGTHASEAANTARICWKQISTATKRSADKDAYRAASTLFRDEFPGHRENSDRAYRVAKEFFGDGDYDQAAKAYGEIPPSSPNYWAAQRMVPITLRALANKDGDNRAQHLEACAQASLDLVALAEKARKSTGAQKALQFGSLYYATALGDLAKWPEALEAINDYLQKYPGQFLMRGKEIDVKIQASLALANLADAEASLAELRSNLPNSIFLAKNVYSVYKALKAAYLKMEPGEEREAMAARAAALWQRRIPDDNPPAAYLSVLGALHRDAAAWEDAADAFATAADLEEEQGKDKKVIASNNLNAATMQFKAAQAIREDDPQEYKKIVNKTRALFERVLVPSEKDRAEVFRKLGDGSKYPKPDTFNKIKKFVGPLLTAAEVFGDSSPGAGVDGRWVGVRLVDYLHRFTRPAISETMSEEERKRLEPFVTPWWNGFELKLKLLVDIQKTGSGSPARKAKKQGRSYYRKIKFEHPSMDGPGRLKRTKKLNGQLN